ncbi:hypothetical protein ACI3KY_11615 [Microbacterium sp. ZW T2_14]|uniref:hypothetical protein n=1 Tax=Microbacterium sp. ZW T2_14 TaxID=3378079 RepID=UPI0038523458
MTFAPPAGDSAAQQLSHVERELSRLLDRVTDAAHAARGLADAVDWQAKAATAFHDRATAWAGDVSGLSCVGETARHDVARARDRAAFAESFAAVFPGGVR